MPNPSVLVIAPQPFYEERGTPISLRLVAAGLTELGYDVDFLTFPVGQLISIPGMNTIRIGNPLRFTSVPIGFSLRKLFLDVLLFLKARKLLKSNNYIRIHASEEAVFAPLFFLKNARERIVYDMASSLPEQLLAVAVFRSSPLQSLLGKLERYALSSVGYVFCSSGLLDHVARVAPDTAATAWIYPSHHAAVDDSAIERLRAELKLDDDAYPIVYAGSFAEYQGLDVVIESIPQIAARVPSAVVVLAGGSDDEIAELQSRISPQHMRNVRLLRKQPRERMPVFLALASALLSSRSYGKNVPLKIFDYMAAKRPIIASDGPAHREILGEGRAALYEPTPDHLAGAIHRVFSSPDESASLAKAAHEYYEQNLGWDKFLNILRRAYDH